MSNAFFQTPNAINEPVKSYAKGSADRLGLLACYHEMYNQNIIDVPMYIGSNEVRTSNKKPINPPHDHQKVLGYFNFGDGLKHSPYKVFLDLVIGIKDKTKFEFKK